MSDTYGGGKYTESPDKIIAAITADLSKARANEQALGSEVDKMAAAYRKLSGEFDAAREQLETVKRERDALKDFIEGMQAYKELAVLRQQIAEALNTSRGIQCCDPVIDACIGSMRDVLSPARAEELMKEGRNG